MADNLERFNGRTKAVEIGGRTLTLSTHRFLERVEQDRFVEKYAAQRLHRMLLNLDPPMVKEDADSLWQECVFGRISRGTMIEALSSAEGIVLNVWLSLRVLHPDVTQKWVSEVMHSRNYELLMDASDWVNSLDKPAREEAVSADPAVPPVSKIIGSPSPGKESTEH